MNKRIDKTLPGRRISKQIQIGGVKIGGGAPIVVQSMTNTFTHDIMSTIRQIKELEDYDCEIIRVAVPDMESARAIREIKKGISIPLIADIHFDYRLALAALESGADCLRLNPGNIGEPERIKTVVLAAKERSVPIRIGVNAGSLPKTSVKKSIPERMVAAAMEQVKLLESDLLAPLLGRGAFLADVADQRREPASQSRMIRHRRRS
jgi:(E)-4-hydroxy-3-methylbut-2-enyl-diphosphate synthase